MLPFRDLVAISRPLFWFNTAVPYVWGWFLSGRSLDAPTLLLIAYFSFPFNLLLHGVNDIFDYETDLRNTRKDSAEGALLVKRVRTGTGGPIASSDNPAAPALPPGEVEVVGRVVWRMGAPR